MAMCVHLHGKFEKFSNNIFYGSCDHLFPTLTLTQHRWNYRRIVTP